MKRNFISSLIKKHLSLNRDLSVEDLASQILNDPDLKNKDISYSLEEMVDAINNAIASMKNGVDEEQKFHIDNKKYHFQSKHGDFSLSVEEIDNIFSAYSSKGLDWTQARVIREFNLSAYQWLMIKSQLRLVKLSNVFSDHTIENTPEHKLSELINQRISSLFKNKSKITEVEYQKVVNREYQKAIKKANDREFYVENIIAELAGLVPSLPKVAYLHQGTNQHSTEEVIISIADIHTGLKVNSYRRRPEYNLDVIVQRLDEVAREVNKIKARKVTLAICGDLVETISGLNHLTTFKELEFGQYGAETIFTVVRILRDFISKVANVKRIYAVAGNHDRISASAKEDRRGDAAMIAFKFLEEGYKDRIEVNFAHDFIDFDFQGIQTFITHGHLPFMKGELTATKKLTPYMDNTKYNLVLYGHIHSRKVLAETSWYRIQSVPSIVSSNTFSDDGGWSSLPGFTIIHSIESPYENAMYKTLPLVVDCPLPLLATKR